MMPVPRVAVRNSLRKPSNPRVGTIYVKKTLPLAYFAGGRVRSLTARKRAGIDAELHLQGRLVHAHGGYGDGRFPAGNSLADADVGQAAHDAYLASDDLFLLHLLETLEHKRAD